MKQGEKPLSEAMIHLHPFLPLTRMPRFCRTIMGSRVVD
jgi:hypothetical protein